MKSSESSKRYGYIRKHNRQLDPTEIVAIPYNLPTLAIYVSSVTIFSMVIGIPVYAWPRTIAQLMQLTVAALVMFVLCGASPYEKLGHTTFAALHLVALCWCAPPIFAKPPAPTPPNTATSSPSYVSVWPELLQRYHGRSSHGRRTPTRVNTQTQQHQQECQSLLQTITMSTCLGCTIPWQILLLYDRGWQWQRWPISVILGSTLGWIMATIFGTLYIVAGRRAS